MRNFPLDVELALPMPTSRWLLAFFLLLSPLLPASAQAQASSVVTTERVRAELLAHAPEGVAPGKPVWLGLQITHQPEWHTYWQNAGDSGLPTTMAWTLPAGVMAGEIAWPAPKKIPVGPLANYGYEGTVLLPVPLTVTPEFKPAPLSPQLSVKLKARWLVCRQECIPEEGEFSLSLPVQGSTALNGAAFQAALDAQPRTLPAGSQATVEGQQLTLRVTGLPAAVRGRTLAFFPETGGVVHNATTPTQSWQGDAWTAQVPLSDARTASPTSMGVVVAEGTRAWRADLPVAGTWPPMAAAAAVSPALEAALRSNAAMPAPALPSSLWLTLLGALLGGLILNLMPCVFPVLAVKVVGFARHSHSVRLRRVTRLAYALGVVLSFLALGGLLLGLRSAGEQLGWGFQLQSPAVVASLAALFTVIGLNLAGVFEFRSLLPSRLASLQAHHPLADAFLSGVLAVAIASPCTAPFMGASLGLAISLPIAQALSVFAALGLGMALPYVVASELPVVVRLLPRPGAWMDIFRRLMAFPMFATVAWLAWVLGQQSGINGAGALLALLVALSLAVWAFTLGGAARRWIGAIALALLATAAWTLGPLVTRPAANAQAAGDARWQPWSAQRVQELVAGGQPVFVDFTAAWCVTCQFNEKTTLSDPAVLADFDARRVALLRADWTRQDPAITAALAALGRNGVPVYVLHAPGRAPVVLSEVLSVQEVRALLAAL